VEEIFGEFSCSTVVSYNSSALFTLKLLYGQFIRCVALMPKEIIQLSERDDNVGDTLIQFLRRWEVEIIDRTMLKSTAAGRSGMSNT
jgi:hypothetical protein